MRDKKQLILNRVRSGGIGLSQMPIENSRVMGSEHPKPFILKKRVQTSIQTKGSKPEVKTP